MLAFIEIAIFVSESGSPLSEPDQYIVGTKIRFYVLVITEVTGYNSKSSKDFRL